MKQQNKLSAVALAITATFSGQSLADVLITEYVEGSGFNKAIELHNTGSQAINLAGYELVRYKDGSEQSTSMLTLENVTIAANSVAVVINRASDTPLPDTVNVLVSGSLQHNGGDAVALQKDGQVVDIVGPIGDRGWGKDVTYQRHASVDTGLTSYDPNEWTALPKNDISGLGKVNDGDTPPAFTCEGKELTDIYAVQGDGYKSPLIASGKYESDEAYTIRGIVTARGESMFKGFYLQAEEGDGNPDSSDGIFVNLGVNPPAEIQPGVEVCVQGKVKEYFGNTQLAATTATYELGEEEDELAATPIEVREDETLKQALERYEGMKVVLERESELRVTRNFSYDYDGRRNNILLSHKAPLMKPTQLHEPLSDAANTLARANANNRVYLETDYKAAAGELPYFPNWEPEANYIRLGDKVTNLEGMVGYSYGEYRIVATNSLTVSDFIRNDDRTDEPELANVGDLRIASFNVLNYFTSHSSVGGNLNIGCADQADADKSRGCNRGAKSASEFSVQRAKIVNAIKAMNADIIGIMEVENNGFGDGSALKDLVDTLNSELSDPAEHYRSIEIADQDGSNKDGIDTKFFGTDAIMVALLYRDAKVTPNAAARVIHTPEQHAEAGAATRTKGDTVEQSPAYNKYQRHSLAQTFTVNGGDAPLTVVVNHLKSKGSDCLEDWQAFETNRDRNDPADLQGHCNEFRVSASKALGEALQDVEGDLLVLGDLNAYGMEDPIRVLTDYDASKTQHKITTASFTTLNGQTYEQQGSEIQQGFGLINLNTKLHGADTYGYTWDEGELGNLDHALANTQLADKVVGIEDWHINSAESNLFEYLTKYSGDLVKSENVYSSSDHDPVIVSVNYQQAASTLVFVNNSQVPVIPTFNRFYWDSVNGWLMPGQTREYKADDAFLSHPSVNITEGSEVRLSVLSLGVFPFSCGNPVEFDGTVSVEFNGGECK